MQQDTPQQVWLDDLLEQSWALNQKVADLTEDGKKPTITDIQDILFQRQALDDLWIQNSNAIEKAYLDKSTGVDNNIVEHLDVIKAAMENIGETASLALANMPDRQRGTLLASGKTSTVQEPIITEEEMEALLAPLDDDDALSSADDVADMLADIDQQFSAADTDAQDQPEASSDQDRPEPSSMVGRLIRSATASLASATQQVSEHASDAQAQKDLKSLSDTIKQAGEKAESTVNGLSSELAPHTQEIAKKLQSIFRNKP